MIIVNFKNYPETLGDGAINLANICKKVEEKTGVPIIPAVTALDVYRIKQAVGGTVFIQSVDQYGEGRFTGKISPKRALEAGADGVLINHSENKIAPGEINKILKILPMEWQSVICVRSLKQAERWSKKNISYIAYEPSELIGSDDKSVSSEKPAAIKKMVELCGDIPVIVGAGIKTEADVKIALSLGAKGILVAKSVVTASNPEEQLNKLAAMFDIIN